MVGGFEQHAPPHGFQMYGGAEDLFHSSSAPAAATTTTLGAEDTQHHTQALLYHLEVLKEKVQQVHSLVSLFLVAPDPVQVPHSESLTMVASAPNLIQDIIAAASSMLYGFQQLAHGDGAHFPPTSVPGSNSFMRPPPPAQPSIAHEVFDHVFRDLDDGDEMKRGGEVLGAEPTLYGSSNGAGANSGGDEIIEVDASDLLAKYTHYCQVCGKGFKRDANLRMHMRAHGDEYKTNAALASPSMGLKEVVSPAGRINIKYSCPHEGCRWNKKHAKFQPLKSMVCVKNHYKRSHCPKMYVCNRCHYKQFAVLSDLRVHEKHCGDLKWMCSCGTNFSRKDKLMGHVALFIGHAPVVNCLTK